MQKHFKIYLTLLLLLSLSLVTVVVYYQTVSIDEGLYLYAAKLFSSGLKPYQDFFFDKLPLSFAIYSLPQKYLAPGLFAGRWHAASFHFTTLLICFEISSKIIGCICFCSFFL